MVTLIRGYSFVVVGAMKCATTSLHQYLQGHPQIYLPPEKEVPFYGDGEEEALGWEKHFLKYYAKAKEDQKIGVVCPLYMYYPNVAEKMRSGSPDAKIIVILRNPLERLKSHYRMAVRVFGEKRTLEEAIISQLEQKALEKSRLKPTQINSYITLGEYGRILANYVDGFDASNIKLVFFDDLAQNPHEVVSDIFSFIGVSDHLPTNLNRKYHVGNSASGISITKRLANFMALSYVRAIGKKVLPESSRRRLRYWMLINRDTSAGQIKADISQDVRRILVEHYKADSLILREKLAVEVPWGDLFNENVGAAIE